MKTKSCFNLVELVQNKVNFDERGFLFENFSFKFLSSVEYWEDFHLRQQNIVYSKKNVIRGMHRSIPEYEQRKVITCLEGEINDVLWDTCPESTTFGEFRSYTLSSANRTTLFIPSCMAHGFQTLSKFSLVSYLLDREYSASHEISISPMDSRLINTWKKPILLSPKDNSAQNLDYFIELLSR